MTNTNWQDVWENKIGVDIANGADSTVTSEWHREYQGLTADNDITPTSFYDSVINPPVRHAIQFEGNISINGHSVDGGWFNLSDGIIDITTPTGDILTAEIRNMHVRSRNNESR